MDMVVCEALKYPMMIQLDSCRYRMMMVMMVLMMMILVRVIRIMMDMVVFEALKYPLMIQHDYCRLGVGDKSFFSITINFR